MARRRGRGRAVVAAVVGDERRIGLWILPIVLIVALAAAVLAAAVTILVYGQRVQALREEVGGAAAAADEATSEIEAMVEGVRAELGLLEGEGSERPDAPPPADPTDRVFAVGVPGGAAGTAVGAAFPFFSDDAQTFLVTAAAVVGSAQEAQVYLPDRVAVAAVAGIDPERGLAILRLEVGGIPPLPWRPPGEPLQIDDPVRVQGVGAPDTAVVVAGRVAGVGREALALDIATSDYLRGAPVLDGGGQVVAVVVAGYRPYGSVGGTLAYLPPIRAVCLRLVQCAPEDLGGLPPLPPVATPHPAPTAGAAGTTAPPPAPAAPPAAPAAPAPAPAPTAPPAVPTGQPGTAPPATPGPTSQPTAQPTPQPTPRPTATG
jgi:hypothetical protein